MRMRSLPWIAIFLLFFQVIISQSNTSQDTLFDPTVFVKRSDRILQLEYVPVLERKIQIGYGEITRKEYTGAVSKIERDQIVNSPFTSIEQAIQGRAAGVFVQNFNGKLGSAFHMYIRGPSSFSARNQPFFVMDGVPIVTDFELSAGGTPLNPLTNINVSDIQSIEILKDAASTAIYGSRAANGVVLIKTLSGIEGAPEVDFRFQTGLNNPTRTLDLLNATEYIEFYREVAMNTDEVLGRGNYFLNKYETQFDRISGPSDWRSGETDTDWQKASLKENSLFQQADFSIRGGNSDTRFYTSLGYLDSQGILENNDLRKISGRLNLDHNTSDRFILGIRMSLSHIELQPHTADATLNMPLENIVQAPITPLRNTTGSSFEYQGQFFDAGEMFNLPVTVTYNPLIENVSAKKETRSFRSLSNVNAHWSLFKGFKLNSELSFELVNFDDDLFIDQTIFSSTERARSWTTRMTNYDFQLYGEFEKRLFKKCYFKWTGGVELQRTKIDRKRIQGSDFPNNQLQTLSNALNTSGYNSITQSSFISHFNRFNFTINDRLLISMSGRIDGSSRFGLNNQFGFFPALSAGWILIKDNAPINFLKLKSSWGKTGNAFIDDFASKGLLSTVSYGGRGGIIPKQIANPSLTWESNTQLDVGIEFGFFGNKVTGELDYYYKKSNDLILEEPITTTSGFSSKFVNSGSMVNSGFEFTLNTRNTQGFFSWTTSLNIAYNKNEVRSLSPLLDDNIIRQVPSAMRVGEPFGYFIGTEYAGVDPESGNALFYINDDESSHATTTDFFVANNRMNIGKPLPDWIFGINNTLEWSKLKIDFFLIAVLGKDNFIDQFYRFDNGCRVCTPWLFNQTADQLNRWQKPGDLTDVPRPYYHRPNGQEPYTSRFVSDGSYIRLRNIRISYQLMNKSLQRRSFRNFEIFLSGHNLFTFTSYKGADPEVADDSRYIIPYPYSIDYRSVPQVKTITFGIQMGI